MKQKQRKQLHSIIYMLQERNQNQTKKTTAQYNLYVTGTKWNQTKKRQQTATK